MKKIISAIIAVMMFVSVNPANATSLKNQSACDKSTWLMVSMGISGAGGAQTRTASWAKRETANVKKLRAYANSADGDVKQLILQIAKVYEKSIKFRKNDFQYSAYLLEAVGLQFELSDICIS
jgi:hypothetical protein